MALLLLDREWVRVEEERVVDDGDDAKKVAKKVEKKQDEAAEDPDDSKQQEADKSTTKTEVTLCVFNVLADGLAQHGQFQVPVVLMLLLF